MTADDGGGRTVPAYVLADDLDAPEDDDRAGRAGSPGVVSLLPALDSSIMGWKQRDWYVDPGHVAQLFDSNGNAGPVVMCDGRVIGAWAQRADATVVTSLLEPVSRTLAKRIDARAAELSAWLDGTRVVPRFPTPLQRRLAAEG